MPQIGWLELLIVVVIAVLIIGPKDFPIVIKKIGKWTGSIKRYFNEIQNDVTDLQVTIEEEISIEKKYSKDKTSKEKSDIILVERRGIAAELLYYLRDKNLKIRVPNNFKSPINHYELNYSFNEKESAKFYYITETDILPMKMKENYKIEKISMVNIDFSKD